MHAEGSFDVRKRVGHQNVKGAGVQEEGMEVVQGLVSESSLLVLQSKTRGSFVHAGSMSHIRKVSIDKSADVPKGLFREPSHIVEQV